MNKHRTNNQTILLGCGLLALIGVLGLAVIIMLTFSQTWHAAQYPGSRPIRSYTNYAFRSNYFRLENAYRTQAPRRDIHDWYVDEFKLRTYEETDECVTLDGETTQFIVERFMSVLVCETSQGRIIFVTRSTQYR